MGGANITFKQNPLQWRNKADNSTLIEPVGHYLTITCNATLLDWGKAVYMRIWPEQEVNYEIIILAMMDIAQMILNGKKFEKTGIQSV